MTVRELLYVLGQLPREARDKELSLRIDIGPHSSFLSSNLRTFDFHTNKDHIVLIGGNNEETQSTDEETS